MTPRLNGKVERSHRIDGEEFYRLLKGVVIDDSEAFNVRLQEWECAGESVWFHSCLDTMSHNFLDTCLVVFMDLALYAVTSVLVEKRSRREVALAIGRSKSWVAQKVLAYEAGGAEALVPRKRGPKVGPNRTPYEVEEVIVSMRKTLVDEGLDGGASTIGYHLRSQLGWSPSRSTIHRILVARGFVSPQPQKRPRNSWIRFEADLANETWQSDVCHWELASGEVLDIITFIDDYSRMILGQTVTKNSTSHDIVTTFKKTAKCWGLPASVLTDNGATFSAEYRDGTNGFQVELLALGIKLKHGKPYHPQTQGKIERYHRTLKAWLRCRTRAKTMLELVAQLEQFRKYYNEVRPHSSRGTTPSEAYSISDKAKPTGNPPVLNVDTRVRHDKIDKAGKVTLRYASKLLHLGVGRAHSHKRVVMLVERRQVRVIDADSYERLAVFNIDPKKNYQPKVELL